MVGGGGNDAPPPPPPLNGGQFLLQLLKNPPQHPRTPSQPPPPQPLPHDPAVAAVGPSIPFPPPSFSSHLSPSRPVLFPPHNYFNQGLGLFPQNPNPNPNFLNPNPNWTSQGHQQLNDQGVLDYLSKLGLIHSNQPLHQQQQLQQQQLQQQQQQQQEQDRHSKLVFGSLHSDFQAAKVPKNANLDYDLASVEKHLLKERELGMRNSGLNGSEADIQRNAEIMQHMQVRSLTFGNYVSTEAVSQQPVRGMSLTFVQVWWTESPENRKGGDENHRWWPESPENRRSGAVV